jgi:hypothetical protein
LGLGFSILGLKGVGVRFKVSRVFSILGFKVLTFYDLKEL